MEEEHIIGGCTGRQTRFLRGNQRGENYTDENFEHWYEDSYYSRLSALVCYFGFIRISSKIELGRARQVGLLGGR